jgi:glyoxylase-like metal-dependent hydrolase (beta-lactamase superfamily II)
MILEKVVVSPFQTNCYILGCEDSRLGVVVDPGDDPSVILETVKRTGLKITHILLTHAHIDHVGAAPAVSAKTGAEVYLHREELPVLRGLRVQAAMFGLPTPERVQGRRYLEDGDGLSLGEIDLVVIFTPGHSPGGICFRGDGFVFVGDTLFQESIGRTDLPGGSLDQLLNSIRSRLLTLSDDTAVYPGHGPQTTIGNEKQFNPFL